MIEVLMANAQGDGDENFCFSEGDEFTYRSPIASPTNGGWSEIDANDALLSSGSNYDLNTGLEDGVRYEVVGFEDPVTGEWRLRPNQIEDESGE